VTFENHFDDPLSKLWELLSVLELLMIFCRTFQVEILALLTSVKFQFTFPLRDWLPGAFFWLKIRSPTELRACCGSSYTDLWQVIGNLWHLVTRYQY